MLTTYMGQIRHLLIFYNIQEETYMDILFLNYDKLLKIARICESTIRKREELLIKLRSPYYLENQVHIVQLRNSRGLKCCNARS